MENKRFFAKSLGGGRADGNPGARQQDLPLSERKRGHRPSLGPPSPRIINSSVCLSQPCPSSLANLTKWKKYDM